MPHPPCLSPHPVVNCRWGSRRLTESGCEGTRPRGWQLPEGSGVICAWKGVKDTSGLVLYPADSGQDGLKGKHCSLCPGHAGGATVF